jgi:hypothetical protein
MPEESTTPDLVERMQEVFDHVFAELTNRRDALDLNLGKGIGLAVVNQKGRPAGSSFEARIRYAAVSAWVENLLVRITMYTDIDEARAAADASPRSGGRRCHRRAHDAVGVTLDG